MDACTSIASENSSKTPLRDKPSGSRLVELIHKIQSDRVPRIGISIQNLNVYGLIPTSDYLHTVAAAPLQAIELLGSIFRPSSQKRVAILAHIDGLVRAGEMLAVLGKPGSGCTTLLKVLAGNNNGIFIADISSINYQGLLPSDIHGEFRAECTYTAELDIHFPELTVAETMKFAAATQSLSSEHNEAVKTVLSGIFDLTGAMSTKVGNSTIRGISGGEKKRLSIAEAMVGMSSIQCWDNSTRGMDSATALKIINHFRSLSKHRGATTIVSLYQASQRALDAFDKVTVLYEGKQIFFGTWMDGLSYFSSLGFERPEQMTTGDFFTALTNPAEAISLTQKGKELEVPVTVEEFAFRWHQSREREILLDEILSFDQGCELRSDMLNQFRTHGTDKYDESMTKLSPYSITIARQVQLCIRRGFQRNKNNVALPISTVLGNTVIGVIVGSVFYNLGENSDALNRRTILLFFVVLLNSFMTGFEVLAVWAQRPIVEKHSQYAFYHPFAEAISAMLVDMPAKMLTSMFFNVVIYFMTNLRRSPGAFFTYLLFCFTVLMTMSMFYRSVGSLSRTLQGSMVPIGIAIIFFILYTGFVIPRRYMHPWFSWTRYLNPVAFAFESVLINELHGRRFTCNQLVPSGLQYKAISDTEKTCPSIGALPGQTFVDGTAYLESAFGFNPSHLWRNYWVLLIILFGLCSVHLISSEYILAKKSKGEMLLFMRNKKSKATTGLDDEARVGYLPGRTLPISKEKPLAKPLGTEDTRASTFCWDNLSYDIKAEGKSKRLLNEINGWVRKGTLTALMGATGAGKTTMLDVLSQRATMGVVSGKIYVNARQRGPDFQRKTGYAQQQDVHLPTATVRESLEFAALLRQPRNIPRAEKLAYVNEVIDVLEMHPFVDAIVGVPGEGLNVEQRKRLTIGLEMAAKPELLLFLDEPTSGLDSQTAWNICTLLRKLADHGQAILCTIHQPSSLLLRMFDRILLIENGGKTVYFGDVGPECRTIVSYLEEKGARLLKSGESSAEWMMEVIEKEASSTDWPEKWQQSREKEKLKQEISKLSLLQPGFEDLPESRIDQNEEYAVPLATQVWLLLGRTFVEYWRTPAFLWAKFLFSCGAAITISFSCWKSPTSLQGLQSQLFAIFTFYTTLSNLMQQIVAQFLERRSLFEAREGPSKTFSWMAFLISAAVTEAVCQTVLAVVTFVLFYYPIGMYIGVDKSELSERAALMFLFFLAFLLFTSTFSHLLTVGMEHRETIVNIGSLLFYLILIFCGVLVPYSGLPKFWTFMYWISPFTYLVRGMFATGVAKKAIVCSDLELLNLPLQGNSTCGEYLEAFVKNVGGRVTNTESTTVCKYCPYADTDDLLGQFNVNYRDRWMDFGVMFVFIIFNVMATFAVYWLVRVPKKQKMVET